jgi:hypothetical protein
MSQFTEDYLRGLGLSTRNNALAYGYSITATAAFAVLSETARPADIGRIFLFVVGASIAFATVNAVVTRGFRARVQSEPPVVVALATSLGILSISAGVGAAALLGIIFRDWPSWLLTGILSTWIYLSVAALEVATARALHINLGENDPEDR